MKADPERYLARDTARFVGRRRCRARETEIYGESYGRAIQRETRET